MVIRTKLLLRELKEIISTFTCCLNQEVFLVVKQSDKSPQVSHLSNRIFSSRDVRGDRSEGWITLESVMISSTLIHRFA